MLLSKLTTNLSIICENAASSTVLQLMLQSWNVTNLQTVHKTMCKSVTYLL